MLYEEVQPKEGIEEAVAKLRSTIAAQVRMWMDREEIDVKSLAIMSTVSDDTIYKLRSGDQNVATDKLAKIAHAMGIPPAVLLMSVE